MLKAIVTGVAHGVLLIRVNTSRREFRCAAALRRAVAELLRLQRHLEGCSIDARLTIRGALLVRHTSSCVWGPYATVGSADRTSESSASL